MMPGGAAFVRRARRVLFTAAALGGVWSSPAHARPQADDEAMMRVERGRFTVHHAATDTRLANSLAASAVARDTFPGLPRPKERVEIWVAPSDDAFRRLVGDGAPEWGNAFAFPLERRIVLHGHRGGKGGDALGVLRHELAHLALHEALGDLPPRWFDEGYASYAAGEWGRDEVLATNFAMAIAFGRVPTLPALDSSFYGGTTAAQAAYAFSYRAVAELAAIDQARGLTLFFEYWRQTGSLEQAMRAAYGLTVGGFEMHWQKATRRRYGGLALVTDVSLGAALLVLMVGPLWLVRRQRDRKRLQAMRVAEAAQAERERASALAALLGEDGPTGPH
ncbi:MAG: hypothetical protein HYV19_02690 [Gemmatimonadetes bacterium]|nr:hypothetical protein [Gemmatimonadota bacterium]